MYTPDHCTATPSLFAWSRDARPVRLVVASSSPPVARAARRDVHDGDWDGVDDVLFGFSATALLLSPLALVVAALLA